MSKIKNGANLNCFACNKLFYVGKARLKTAKYCSDHCRTKVQWKDNKYIYNCLKCGKLCEAPPSSVKKYCSLDCSMTSYSDRYDRKIRDAMLRKLRPNTRVSASSLKKAIFSLREHKCEKCGWNEHRSALELHHIDENARNNSQENLQILCANCHRRTHWGDFKVKKEDLC